MTLPALRSAWPAAAHEAWAEREAIMWADGEPDAARRAEERVRLEWGRLRTGSHQERRSGPG
jgi:hypothetical protein